MPKQGFGKIGGKTYLIFTDLDGTLLDEHYSAKPALPMLRKLMKMGVPVILCSGKTRVEQERIRKQLGVEHPFIVENGSAIYIPKGYFGKPAGMPSNKYEIIVLGTSFKEIRKEIEGIKHRYYIKGYADMSVEEVAEITGLDMEGARLAKLREFSETIVEADDRALKLLSKKFNVVCGGRFIHVFGKGADKGRAVELLTKLYGAYGEVTTIGIGNSYNDEAMLRAVEIPALVRNPDGKVVKLSIDNVYYASAIGPKGWREVVKKFVLEGDNGKA
jgi:mannosyl-3-phosphoglycerate phosphatase family protein